MLRSGEQRSAKARFSRTVTSERWSTRFTHGLGDSAGAGRFERRARAGSVEGSPLTERSRPSISIFTSRSLFLGLVDFEDFDQARESQDFPGGCTEPEQNEPHAEIA